MKNIYLEVFQELDKLLEYYPSESDDYDYLQAILKRRLKNLNETNGDNFVPDRISRKMIYVMVHGGEIDKIDSNVANKEIKFNNLETLLDEFVGRESVSELNFGTIGYRPIFKFDISTGGRGKESQLWFDIEKYIKEENTLENDLYIENPIDIFKITYSRKDANEVKPSWFTRLVFKNNELKMRSGKGIAVMLFFMSGFIVEFLLVAFAFLVFLLIRDLKTLKLWEALLYCTFVPMAYLSWVGLFRPLHNLMTHRVIKAPDFFISISAENADIEMYS